MKALNKMSKVTEVFYFNAHKAVLFTIWKATSADEEAERIFPPVKKQWVKKNGCTPDSISNWDANILYQRQMYCISKEEDAAQVVRLQGIDSLWW